jgi:hypothetical protein
VSKKSTIAFKKQYKKKGRYLRPFFLSVFISYCFVPVAVQASVELSGNVRVYVIVSKLPLTWPVPTIPQFCPFNAKFCCEMFSVVPLTVALMVLPVSAAKLLRRTLVTPELDVPMLQV